jgi:hypothetical protein
MKHFSPKSPTNDLLSVMPVIEASGARYGLLGVGAHVDDDGELDLVVHDVDRQVLSSLREAGFQCAHYSNSLFECYRADALLEDDGFKIWFPTLPPLSDAFSRVERKAVRGVEVNVIAPNDTALWFLLNRREDGLQCAQRLFEAGLLDVAVLEDALQATHSLPETRSTWVLLMFDRDLAASRLKQLGDR